MRMDDANKARVIAALNNAGYAYSEQDVLSAEYNGITLSGECYIVRFGTYWINKQGKRRESLGSENRVYVTTKSGRPMGAF